MKQLNGDFDETDKSFISNNAMYDRETGEWKVMVKNKQTGLYEEKEVSRLDKEDVKNLMPEKHEERMEKYMQDILSLVAKTKGEEETEKLVMTNADLSNTIKQVETRVADAMTYFNENFPKLLSEVKIGQELATEQYKGFMDTAKLGNEAIDNKAAQIQETANNLSLALQETERIIREANKKIAEANGVGYDKPTPNENLQSQKQETVSSVKAGDVIEKNTKNPIIKSLMKKGQSLGNEYNGGNEYVEVKGGNMVWTKSGAEAYNKVFATPITSNDSNKKATSQKYQTANGMPSSNITSRSEAMAYDDFIANANNSPIVSAASNITKIGDGLVQSDPKDVAIFAKEGGVIGNFLYTLDKKLDYALGGNKSLSFDTLKVEMDGNLELTSGGQTMNIMEMFRNEPTLLRSLARMLVKELSSSMNGGRGSNSVGISNEWRL